MASAVIRIVAAAAVAAALTIAVLWAGSVLGESPADYAVYAHTADLGDALYSRVLHDADMPAQGLPFTYTPFAAALFLPLRLLPEETGAFLFGLTGNGIILLLIGLLLRSSPALVRWLVGAAAGLSIATVGNVAMGQINLLLMGLVLADCYLITHPHRWGRIPRGAAIGIAAAIKLTPLLFVIYLLVTGRIRAAAIACCTVVGAFAIGYSVFPHSTIRFFTDTVWHLTERVDVFGWFATPANASLSGLLAQAGWFGPTQNVIVTAAVAAAGLTATAFAARRSFSAALVGVGLLTSTVSPIAWIHHWVYLLPAAMLIVRSAQYRYLIAFVPLLLGGPYLIIGVSRMGFPSLPWWAEVPLRAAPVLATCFYFAWMLRGPPKWGPVNIMSARYRLPEMSPPTNGVAPKADASAHKLTTITLQ